MRANIRAKLLASALAVGALFVTTSATVINAEAANSRISFRYFHQALRGSGEWFYSDRWGRVWQPYVAQGHWRPYTRGHWVNTYDRGWLWVSNEDFGDITYHYGRWVNDPDDGWLWLPGYVWSPAWVVWRQSGHYTGWMPMPPDRRFLQGDEFGNASVGIRVGGVSISFNNWGDTRDYYGYSNWYGRDYSRDRFNSMWVFVPEQHFGDRDYYRYQAPQRSVTNIVRTSTNITNYTVVNNYVVNRSVRDQTTQGGQPRRVRAADVIKQPDLIVPVDTGRQIQAQMRTETPRGMGTANSAPKPTQEQIQTLSTVTPQGPAGSRAERRSRHLMDRNAAAALAQPGGTAPSAAPNPTTAPATTAKAPEEPRAAPQQPTAPHEKAPAGGSQSVGNAMSATPSAGSPSNAGRKHRKGVVDNGTNAATGTPNPDQPNGQRKKPHDITAAPTTSAPVSPTPAVQPAGNPQSATSTTASPAGPSPQELRAAKKKARAEHATPQAPADQTPATGATSAPANQQSATPGVTAPTGQTPQELRASKKKARTEHAASPAAPADQTPAATVPATTPAEGQAATPSGDSGQNADGTKKKKHHKATETPPPPAEQPH